MTKFNDELLRRTWP